MSQSPLHKDLSLDFGAKEKEELDALMRMLEQSDNTTSRDFLDSFTNSSSPSWIRYSQAIYNHPKTWWIGIIQLTMLTGVWGDRHRRAASMRQSALSQIVTRYFSTRSDEGRLSDAEKIVLFNLKFRKADVLGRLHGGLFTNYAATGGLYGKRLSNSVKIPAAAVNFTLASFGACVEAIAQGYRSYGALAQSILIGKPESISDTRVFNGSFQAPPDVDSHMAREALLSQVVAVHYLNGMKDGPVPVREFCSRPENQNLKKVCE